MLTPKTKLFYLLGGYETLRHVHKIFYDKLYAHPRLGQFFAIHDQQFIEDQQTAFMAEKFGGPRKYHGKEPGYTHEHMYISDELFELRQTILRESLVAAKVTTELAERWLSIDGAFKKQVTNSDLESFKKIHTFKERVVFESEV